MGNLDLHLFIFRKMPRLGLPTHLTKVGRCLRGMDCMNLFRLSVLFSLIAFSVGAQESPQLAQSATNLPQPQPATAAASGATTVYVSDFDLDVVHRKPTPKPAQGAPARSNTSKPSRSPSGVPRIPPAGSVSESATSQGSESPETPAEESPSDQATTLVNAVSESILQALTHAGYDARRMAKGEPLPERGLRIRGVFAEADEQNRARRLLIGGVPVTANMLLFVGVNSLTRPEQPLYELADPKANDPRHGPVITVTSYAPAERFELSRDPSGEELEKIATKIAADLSALVSANRLSLAQ